MATKHPKANTPMEYPKQPSPHKWGGGGYLGYFWGIVCPNTPNTLFGVFLGYLGYWRANGGLYQKMVQAQAVNNSKIIARLCKNNRPSKSTFVAPQNNSKIKRQKMDNMTSNNTTTAADRAAKVINYALTHSVNISPPAGDEPGWARWCDALKVLGYTCTDFVALSNCPARDAVAKWNSHKTPHKYFKNADAAAATILHFAADAGVRAKDICSPDTWTTHRPTRPTAPTPTPKPEKLVTMPLDVVTTMAERVTDTALARYLCGLFDPEAVKRTLAAYMVGGCEPPYHNDAENVGLWTAYPLISAAGVVVDCKLMGYRADGHRAKRADGSGLLAWWLSCTKQLGDGCTRAQWCCFGDHLAAQFDAADPVNVVESEKTALMASLYFGGYWVAVGGLGFLTSDRLAAHKRRKVIVYPDIDGAAQWTAKAKTLREAGFDVVMNKWCYDMGTKLSAAGLIPQKFDLGDVIDHLAANRIYLDTTAAPAPAAHTAAVDDTDTTAENTDQNTAAV